MNHDIFQPVPQGVSGAQDAENSRIEAIADELRRLCQLYEAQRRDCQQNVNHLEAEQRAAETFSKEHGLWLPIENVFDLGVPGPSGNENDTYVTDDSIYKVNCAPRPRPRRRYFLRGRGDKEEQIASSNSGFI